MTVPPKHLLLATKLRPPSPVSSWVSRSRLLSMLDTTVDRRLTLVVAPAGFGKSTLVAQWLAAGVNEAGGNGQAGRSQARPGSSASSRRSPFGWLSLDEYDQDPARLLMYLVAAVEQIYAGWLPHTAALLESGQPPLHVGVQTFLAELANLPGPLTLVLDDYHVVTSASIHQMFVYMLHRLPAGCRMIVLSRFEPPLAIGRLRAEGHVAELGAADLRFTAEESAALLEAVAAYRPDAAGAEALVERAEGWAIGLQLAGMALRAGVRGPLLLRTMTKDMLAYLADEVLAQLPADVQRALLALAIPERFCAGLCAALLDPPGDDMPAEARLRQLVAANLFLIPLDEDGQWYRYHHLFRDLLRQRMRFAIGEREERALHRRAAGWFERAGLLEEALRHYLAAGEVEAGADLVERAAGEVLTTRVPNWILLRSILALPGGVIDRRPDLLLLEAFLRSTNYDVNGVADMVARIEALTSAAAEQAHPYVEADLDALRCFLAFWRGDLAQAIRVGERALAGGSRTRFYAHTVMNMAVALGCAGRRAEGIRLIEAALERASSQAGWRHLVTLFGGLYGIAIRAGALDDLRIAAERELAAAREQSANPGYYAHYTLGLVAYERNDLASAAAHFDSLIAGQYQIPHIVVVSGMVGRGLVCLAYGDPDEASAWVERARCLAEESKSAVVLEQVDALAARVALARGDIPGARDLAKRPGSNLHFGTYVWLETPPLNRVRALCAAGDLACAEARAAACVADAAQLHNTRVRIAALATQALVYHARGRAGRALATMARSVRLAAPAGFVRTFVDLGPPAWALLADLRARGVEPEYLRRVLAATAQPVTSACAARSPSIPELLTPRELAVLRLLAERLSQQEIAERLVIALNTVKKHTASIYDKLGVHNRRDAIAAAQALGLLVLPR